MISRATLLASQNSSPEKKAILIEPSHLFLSERQSPVEKKNRQPRVRQTLQEALTDYKKELILASVKRNEGNWSKAASELGLHRSNLYHLRDQLGLKK